MKLPSAPSSTLPATSIEVRPASVADGRVPALKLWGIRRSIGLAIVAALLIVVLLIAGALWYAGFPGVRRDDTVTAGTLFDLLKLVFAVVAGIGGVAALVVAYRRQRVAEHTNKLAEFAHGLARLADKRAEVSKALAEAAEERAALESDRNGVRLFNERFVKASEQLGSEKAAVRLAGVYSMAGLADDWQQGRQTCIDVLCAYLRMPYTPPDASAGEPHSGRDDEDFEQNALAARQEREVRRTVMRVIGEHLSLDEEDPTSWCGRDFDFTGAVFDGGSFNAARFSGGKVSFKEATFGGGSLFFAGVTFSGGEVSFDGATFSGGEVLCQAHRRTSGPLRLLDPLMHEDHGLTLRPICEVRRHIEAALPVELASEALSYPAGSHWASRRHNRICTDKSLKALNDVVVQVGHPNGRALGNAPGVWVRIAHPGTFARATGPGLAP